MNEHDDELAYDSAPEIDTEFVSQPQETSPSSSDIIGLSSTPLGQPLKPSLPVAPEKNKPEKKSAAKCLFEETETEIFKIFKEAQQLLPQFVEELQKMHFC